MTAKYESIEEVKKRIEPRLRSSEKSSKSRTPRALFLARLLLTGKPWDRRELFVAIMNAYESPSVRHTVKTLEELLPFAGHQDVGKVSNYLCRAVALRSDCRGLQKKLTTLASKRL